MRIFWKVSYKLHGMIKYTYFRKSTDAFIFAKKVNAMSIYYVKEK